MVFSGSPAPVSPIIPLSLVMSPLAFCPSLPWNHSSGGVTFGMQYLLDGPGLLLPGIHILSMGSSCVLYHSSCPLSCSIQSLSSTKNSLLFLPIAFHFCCCFAVDVYPSNCKWLSNHQILFATCNTAQLTSCLCFSFSFGYRDTFFLFLIFLLSSQFIPVYFPCLLFFLFPLSVASVPLVFSLSIVPYALLLGDWSPFML